MRKKYVILILFVISAVLCSCSVIAEPADMPEVWVGGFYPLQLLDAPLSDYDRTFSKITGLNIFISTITENEPQTLQPLAKLLKDNGIKISIEVGGLYSHEWAENCGEQSASIDIAALDKWAAAGGTVDRIFMDEPIGRVTSKYGDGWGRPEFTYLTYTEAGNELADYIFIIREKYPEIEIYLGANFPNWGWKGEDDFHSRGDDGMYRGDYYIALTEVLDILLSRNAVIDGFEADNPYEYYIGTGAADKSINWVNRLSELEKTIEDRGLKFNMIINSEGGKDSSAEFYSITKKYLDLYLTNGGTPDVITVESWYKYPDKTVPEEKRGTLFRTAMDVYDKTFAFYSEKDLHHE